MGQAEAPRRGRARKGLDLSAKVAIVTGATRGIGRAIALGLAEAGCSIVVTGRTETPRRQLPGTVYTVAEEVEGLGQAALPVGCDVRDEDSVRAMAQTSLDKFGRIDVLVNNAGIGSYAPFLETSLDAWERVLAVNVRGTFLCCQAVLPTMIENSTRQRHQYILAGCRFCPHRGPRRDRRRPLHRSTLRGLQGRRGAPQSRPRRGDGAAQHRRQRPQACQARAH